MAVIHPKSRPAFRPGVVNALRPRLIEEAFVDSADPAEGCIGRRAKDMARRLLYALPVNLVHKREVL